MMLLGSRAWTVWDRDDNDEIRCTRTVMHADGTVQTYIHTGADAHARWVLMGA